MSEFINTIDVLGDDAVIDSIIQRDITEFADNTVQTFGDCSFYGCTELTSVDAPACTEVRSNAFNKCTALTKINLPALTTVYAAAFGICTSLESVELPLVRNFSGGGQFQDCTALKSLKLPLWESGTTGYEFRRCSALVSADFFKAKSFRGQTFLDCTALKSLILRNTEAVCSLGNVNVLQSTPIADGAGYVYVPKTLVDSYKAATNWSTYADQFRALEDYTVDGTITGELDETKI